VDHVMHKPFIALMELCVLGGKDYFCLNENVVYGSVVDGDRASATSAKWLSRASF